MKAFIIVTMFLLLGCGNENPATGTRGCENSPLKGQWVTKYYGDDAYLDTVTVTETCEVNTSFCGFKLQAAPLIVSTTGNSVVPIAVLVDSKEREIAPGIQCPELTAQQKFDCKIDYGLNQFTVSDCPLTQITVSPKETFFRK